MFAQSPVMPPIESGVSHELAKWRAARYSDVRYKLNLTLEKMSPVLKGTMEIRVKVSEPGAIATGSNVPIILDWRKIKGHEEKSTISNVVVNGKAVKNPVAIAPGSDSEHLIVSDGVVAGENVIKLDFTSPILTSGSAITRYVDKEDGAEYIYSLFVPSDASTAFPVFDQPDLKARFQLDVYSPVDWKVVANTYAFEFEKSQQIHNTKIDVPNGKKLNRFIETKPLSTYVFAFAAGDFLEFKEKTSAEIDKQISEQRKINPIFSVFDQPYDFYGSRIYLRRSQAEKFKPHAAEVFRLNREAIKYFEEYFDYKFPFPKYDLVLIPEFPFGGMEHAGATFLRESAIIFPQEPTKNDHISRAVLIFHEAAHQWFGDTVTMRWFDDLWLKEGFANFAAYKAMERIMPEMNAWKVFYERVKQAAYQTDSTKGTTPIYQEIKNLSAAKSAYGNIVYNKAPAFLRQSEFYLGEDKFQTAVRAFLKKHEFKNAGWEDLVSEFEKSSKKDLTNFVDFWVKRRGLLAIRTKELVATSNPPYIVGTETGGLIDGNKGLDRNAGLQNFNILVIDQNGKRLNKIYELFPDGGTYVTYERPRDTLLVFPNYQDYGYGIFLLDTKSRDYVLKNIQNEKDPFLRAMMWGALWDSVREGELDPREYVELAVRVLSGSSRTSTTPSAEAAATPPIQEGSFSAEDESTIATLLGRTSTALNYYLSDAERVSSPHVSKGSAAGVEPSLTVGLRTRLENLLIDQMQNAPTLGQRITYYRAFLNVAASENARGVLKDMLKGGNPSGSEGVNTPTPRNTLPTGRVSASTAPADKGAGVPLKTKDKFDIVTKLLILGDADAPKLLAELEKAETSDEAKRYAYAARAGIATAENKAKYWNDFVNNKEISESWIEAAFGPWNSIRHSELTLPYLQKALQELPNHKRSRKIFFVNGWLGAFIGGQRSEEALVIVNKFLADNPNLDKDLRLKILENVDVIERAVKIRAKFGKN
jgi:aminopeptidase N